MDVNTIAALATNMSQARTADAVSVAVLKMALDMEAQSASQLVQVAAASMQAYNNPPNLGNAIDTFA